MRYCVLFPKAENIHLTKDVGMIPYKLNKLYGYKAFIACYNNGNYTKLKNEVKGLQIDFINKKYGNPIIDGILYLMKKAKEIDILQVFHITLSSLFYVYTYKFFNPEGKVILKLDCTHELIERIEGLNKIKFKFLNMFLNKISLIGVEQKELYKKLKNILIDKADKLMYFPNGVDFDFLNDNGIYYSLSVKENIILNVARLGSPEKRTDVLLEAFSRIPDIKNSDWKLVLVGSIERKFQDYIDNFFSRNPHLRNQIIFKGKIENGKALFQEYMKAKIFCLTSEYESFGISLVEAAALGDVIVSTDVGIAKELIWYDNDSLVKAGDVEGLSLKLYEYINSSKLSEYSLKTYNLCRETYDWNKIIRNLNTRINELFKKGRS